MKLAIANDGLSAGGRRFERALIAGLRAIRPTWEITYFTDINTFNDTDIEQEFLSYGVNILPYQSLGIPLRTSHNSSPQAQKISHLHNFDCILLTWPYHFYYQNASTPVVFVPHDFNFCYFFGTLKFSRDNAQAIYANLKILFEKGVPVVATPFIHSEVEKFFPTYAQKTRIVSVPAMSNMLSIDEHTARSIVETLGINDKFFLYPCSSIASYKNLEILSRALYLLKQRGYKAKIVYIGYQTSEIKGIAGKYAVEQVFDNRDCDIIGLGFVDNSQLAALMHCCEAVVTPSLYEAANGPGIDAWVSGVPVAMSNLDFYTEHMNVHGVYATLFDPLNVEDVAEKLACILTQPDKMRKEAQLSQSQMLASGSSETFASEYAAIIEEACATQRTNS